MTAFLDRFSAWWCRWFHGRPMWPVQGYYRCSTCLRPHPVPWEQGKAADGTVTRG